MGYLLKPHNRELEPFEFGAFSFPVLLEACGYLFPCVHNGAQWYCVWGADPRMPEGDDYPRILSMDGFAVTAEEARIMARMARNYVAVQQSLSEEHRGKGTTATQMEFRKDDVVELLMKAMSGSKPGPWPVKIRDDFTAKFEAFAPWAEASEGFEIR